MTGYAFFVKIWNAAVMEQVDEDEIRRLVTYLNHIYEIADQELKARKVKGRKEQENEEHI